jgi:hypothetical protein
MKNFKGFSLGLVLGLGLAISSIGFAQNVMQTDQKKEAESCCAMESCCCKGESCSMKDHAKKDHSMTSSSKDGCCCCSGDSCNMKMKDMKDKQ